MIKYSKFTDNIEPGNFADTFCQDTDKFLKSGGYTFTLTPDRHAFASLSESLD